LKAKAMDAISEGRLKLSSVRYFCSFLIEVGLTLNLCILGNLEEAIQHLTEAILLNPTSAILYGNRGTTTCTLMFLYWVVAFSSIVSSLFSVVTSIPYFSASVFLKLNKPNAAIRDADAALKVCLPKCDNNSIQ